LIGRAFGSSKEKILSLPGLDHHLDHRVGWVERSETQHFVFVGFRSSTQPTFHALDETMIKAACRTKSRIKMRLLLILLEVLFRARWRTDSNLKLRDRSGKQSAILNLNFIGFIYKSESLSASESGSKKEGFDADSKRPSLGQI
jgi:hypothetical protein